MAKPARLPENAEELLPRLIEELGIPQIEVLSLALKTLDMMAGAAESNDISMVLPEMEYIQALQNTATERRVALEKAQARRPREKRN